MSSADAHEPVKLASVRMQLFQLIGDRRWLVLALAGTSVVSGFVEAGFLAVVAQVAVSTVSKGDVHSAFDLHVSTDTLILLAAGLGVLRLLLQVPLSVLPARITADVQAGLRRRLFAAFIEASWTVQSADREGQMQETMTSQVMQATAGALQATSLINSSITFLVLMVSAFALNVIAAVSVLVLASTTFALMRPLRTLGHQRARELSEAQVRYARGIAEANRLAEDTQVFGVAAAQRARIDQLIKISRDLYFRTQLFVKLIPNLYQSLLFLLVVGVLAGIQLVANNRAGALGAIVLLLLRAAQNGLSVQTSYQTLNQSLPFIERTQKAEEAYRQSTAARGELPLAGVQTLSFQDVSFAYSAERPVLSDISFDVAGSEAIGVIGPSGAGKSTLIQVLLQLRPPSSGHYLINGVDAAQFKPEEWHRHVSYVPQEPRLIHASVADNIRFFREVDDDAVERAGRLARIHDDVMGWPDGYETIVGPRADAVSGGQQQRICLARALVAHPEVLVLDEPTSALDPHSETLIQDSLTALKSGMTLFIIAHRMSTLDMCDRVMVILDGRLVAFDTKALLQEHNPYYRSAAEIAMGTAGRSLL